MQVLSVNVGMPREIEWKGDTFVTGIFKSPAAGHIPVRSLNLKGDRQADLTVHGGTDKAVYAYPVEHYAFWREVLQVEDMPYGSFGENLTLTGLMEDDVHIGDRFRIGTTVLVVTQPRVPCYKLAAKFRRPEIVREFLESGRSGFYLAVLREGGIGAGDAVQVTLRDVQSVRIADLNLLYRRKSVDTHLMRRALQVEALAPSWRVMLIDRLERSNG